MRSLLLAGSILMAGLGLPATVTAQEPGTATTTSGTTIALTPEQQAVVNSWAADRQTDFRTWPSEYQTYFWTLSPEQQSGYWAMTADQRGMIYRMSPEQRAKAWEAVRAQMAGQTPATPPDQANPPGMGMPTTGVPSPSAAAQAVPPAMPADTSYQGGPYKGALTPPPADAMNKTYPVCTRQITDSCQNPGEGGAPGRSRAVNRRR